MADAFHHEALLYRGDDEYVAGTAPFVRAGVAAGESVLVAVCPDKRRLIEAGLNGEGGAIRFVDMDDIGRNPARIIPVWRQFVEETRARGDGVRGIGEPIWPGRSAHEIDECQRLEALLNLAFDGGTPWPLLCLYDAASLPDEVLMAAEATHPHVEDSRRARSSSSYRGRERALAALEGSLPEPGGPTVEIGFGYGRLREIRGLVADRGQKLGLGPERADDLMAAVHELVTNSIRHGGGVGTVRLWREDGAVACEVADAGLLDDPLAGRRRPLPQEPGGRGLWIVNQLCDLVQLRSSPAGTVARVWINAA